MRKATVRCGGHVTLLFSIHSESSEPLEQGSRGAGFCVEAGVECTVAAIPLAEGEEFNLSVAVMAGDEMLDDEDSAFLYVDLFDEFLKRGLIDESKTYLIDARLELPLSQGFGMSAAGLLATASALCRVLEVDTEIAEIAHLVERSNSSGLGDVLAASVGGVELRLEPGAPPSQGQAVSFSADAEVILCWDPEASRHTRIYIDDADWKARITEAGLAAVTRLSSASWDSGRWPELLNEAELFSAASGMMDDVVRLALLSKVKAVLPQGVKPLLCMLGTSVCVLPLDLSAEVMDEVEAGLHSSGVRYVRTRIS